MSVPTAVPVGCELQSWLPAAGMHACKLSAGVQGAGWLRPAARAACLLASQDVSMAGPLHAVRDAS